MGTRLARMDVVEGMGRCCLGFYGNQIEGLSDVEMLNMRSPSEFVRKKGGGRFAALLLPDTLNHTVTCTDLIVVNDAGGLTDEEREGEISSLFKQIDVDVTFVD